MKPIYGRLSAALLVCFSLGVAVSHAQDNTAVPAVVDLPAVLKLVREVSPRLSIERQGVAGAEASRITAGAYPNPTINYGRYRPSAGGATLFDGTRQEQTIVELPLLIAGQRGARVEKAERDIEAARARVISGASSLAAEAGSAFIALLAAQEKAALLATTNEELVRLRDIVAGRESSGVASRYDVTRLQIELGGFRAKLEDAKADISDRAGNLAVLLGLPQWRPRAAGELRPLVLNADALANPRDRAGSSPASITALREETAAQSGVEVARRERWPVPSVSAGRQWTSEPYGAANFLGLSVEIPILDSRRGAFAKAESEAITATLRRELAVAEVSANLERFANIIAARQAALQGFQEDAAARLPLLKQMAEDAYRLGRSSIFELLDATRSRYDLQQTRIDLVAALVDAQLRFLATSGELDRSMSIAAEPAPVPR